MSNVINKENVLVLLKYIGYALLIILGFLVTMFLVQTVFNLGTYVGTFLRGLYNLVCQY